MESNKFFFVAQINQEKCPLFDGNDGPVIPRKHDLLIFPHDMRSKFQRFT